MIIIICIRQTKSESKIYHICVWNICRYLLKDNMLNNVWAKMNIEYSLNQLKSDRFLISYFYCRLLISINLSIDLHTYLSIIQYYIFLYIYYWFIYNLSIYLSLYFVIYPFRYESLYLLNMYVSIYKFLISNF